MTNVLEDFIAKYRDRLIQIAQDYLDEKVSHREIKEYAWGIIDDWKTVPEKNKVENYIKGEKAFWAIIWEINTGADDEHWKDNCPQRALLLLIGCLKEKAELPSGYDARRPD
ncbi:MAG: hypothetical protein DRP56_08900 [Planctomycetota bacterium]|nr:MAG: hypothetical protein DRP56_08900 [Planctomycetota bacterium]